MYSKIIKSFTVISLAISFISILLAYSPPVKAEGQAAGQPCNLVLGWHIWPPFQYLDERQKPIGFQIELIKQLEQLTGCKLELRLQSFSENLADISEGKIDLTMDATITQQRTQFGHFSIPYRREMFVLYVKAGNVEQCRGVELPQLLKGGFKMSVSKGVLYGDLITQIQQDQELNALLHYSESNHQELQLFKNNKIDGILEDPIVMAYMKRSVPGLRDVTSCQITTYSGLVSIIFSKKTVNQSVVERFNRAISELKKDVHYKQLWGI